MKRTLHLVVLLLVPVLINACGFQLQTRVELPSEMRKIRLEIKSPYSPFARRLETLLEQNGVQIAAAGEKAVVLEVPQNRMRKEIQSIGNNARVREYLLRHTVQFRLLDAEGKEMIPVQTFEQSRVYSFTEQDILAAEREDEFLRKDLSDSLARMVIRRLGTYRK